MNDRAELIDAYLDGDLSPAEAAGLEAWLAESPEHRRQFSAQALDHLLLRDVLATAPAVVDGFVQRRTFRERVGSWSKRPAP